MPSVQLVIDIYAEHDEPRRALRTVDFAGVPRKGEIIWAARMLALAVRTVSWHVRDGSATLFLGATESGSSGVKYHEDAMALELRESQVNDLRKSGWDIEERD